MQFTVAGLSAVKWTHRVMHNVDLTHVVSCLFISCSLSLHDGAHSNLVRIGLSASWLDVVKGD